MEGSMMAIEEKTLQINGMSCTACASSIEKGISKMDGVEEANVNFALERTSITYDPEKTNVDAFKQKIKDLGYDVVQEKTEFDIDRKSTRLNSSHVAISYAVFCLKKK